MLNRCSFMGRLTRDPELRHTTTDKAVANFTIAVDRDFDRDKADFIECVAWNKTAEFAARYFKKGQLAAVSGRMQNRDWTDKDGNKRRVTELICDALYFGGDKPAAKEATIYDIDDTDDGDLPF